MKEDSAKKNQREYLHKEKIFARLFSSLLTNVVDDIDFITNILKGKRLGKLISTLLTNIKDGIEIIINILSKRLTVNFSSFPSDSHTLILFIFIFTLRLLWILFTYPYSSYGVIEELLLELTAAKNYVHYGFLKTFFLPDYVSSNINADHAVVYTHMPPLAAIIVALLLKAHIGAFGIRSFFISINTLGLFYGYLFFKKIFNERVSFFIIFFLSINFAQSFQWSDHFDYSWIWFFLFGAAYHFINFAVENNTKRINYEAVAFFLIVFLTSLTSYVILLTQFVLLILIYIFNIARPKAKYMSLLVIAILLGVSLHLLQNILYFGFSTFQEEIVLTLKNRIMGESSTAELGSFFREHNMVNWGAAAFFDMKAIIKQLGGHIKDQVFFGRGFGWIISIFLIYFDGYNIKNNYRQFIYVLKVIFAFFGAAISWHIVFPAHAQGYISQIYGWGTIPAIVMGGACVLSIEGIRKNSNIWRNTIIFLMIILLLVPVLVSIKRMASSAYRDMNKSTYNTLSKLKKYSDEVIWTNLPSVYVSYFTDSVVAGRCTGEAVKNKDMSLCYNVWINSQSEKGLELLRSPTLFVYSKSHISDNMTKSPLKHLDDLETYLGENLSLIEKIDDDIMIYKYRTKRAELRYDTGR